MRGSFVNTEQAEYLEKPFAELSWPQRALFIVHVSAGVAVMGVVAAAPFVGIWQIVSGEILAGLGNIMVVLALSAMVALLSRM